jgi:formamidopyrimidine-DNA glycosylase
MPELPEVETMRRGILSVSGCRIQRVRRPPSRLRPIHITPSFRSFKRRAEGQEIVGVERAGKRIVLNLDSSDRIVLEPRMSGRVLLSDPPDTEHLRLVFDLGGRVSRLYFWSVRGLGSARMLSATDFACELGPERLGPDALDVTPQEMHERLGSSSRAVKVALLDQRFIAGIGNIYASEILHRAKTHPEMPCCQMRPVKWRQIQEAIDEVLQAAIRLHGSTLSDGNYRNAHNKRGSFQNCHRVYQRAGERCVQCGRGKIVRIVQAQRSTYFCPVCQRRPRSQ